MRPRSITPSFFAARAQRGFTLIELAVVVIIVSVFAALAIPQVTKQLANRRVQETAQRVLSTYQQARERAIGRGGAVLVRFTAGVGGQGRLQIFEGRVGSTDTNQNCPSLPNPSCTGVNWSDTATNGESFLISDWELSTDFGLGGVYLEMFQDANSNSGASTTYADICFTPLGRTFAAYVANTTLTPLTEVPMGEVYRTVGAMTDDRIGLTRRVILLPNGGGRLEAELVP